MEQPSDKDDKDGKDSPVKESKYDVRSDLTLYDIIGHVIKFKWNGQSPDGEESEGGFQEEELPHLAAAWLMILHDILVWAEKSAVANNPDGIRTAAVVRASHEVVPRDRQGKAPDLRWPAPKWNAFLALNIFWKLWSQAKSVLVPLQPGGQVAVEGDLFRLLVCAWIECSLETFVTFVTDISLDTNFRERSLIKRLSSWKQLATTQPNESEAKDADGPLQLDNAAVRNFEQNVMKAASDLYDQIRKQKKWQSPRNHVSVVDDRTDFMTGWFEQDLPLLFTQLYVPMADDDDASRRESLEGLLDSSKPEGRKKGKKSKDEKTAGTQMELYRCWLDDAPFLLDEIDQTLAKLFPAKRETKKAGKAETEKPDDPPQSVSRKPLGTFGGLHRALEKPADREG